MSARCQFDESDAALAVWNNSIVPEASRTVTASSSFVQKIQAKVTVTLDGTNQDFNIGATLGNVGKSVIWLNGIGGAVYAGLNDISIISTTQFRINAVATGGPTESVNVVIIEFR